MVYITPVAPFLTLPVELFFSILQYFDGPTLYRLSSVCKHLNSIALHALFQQYCKEVYEEPEGRLLLYHQFPDFVLPALGSALSLPKFTQVDVTFTQDTRRLIPELKLLKTSIISHAARPLRCLRLNLALVGLMDRRLRKQLLDSEKLAVAMQELVDAALQVGCWEISIETGFGFRGLYTPSEGIQVQLPAQSGSGGETKKAVVVVRTPKKKKSFPAQLVAGIRKCGCKRGSPVKETRLSVNERLDVKVNEAKVLSTSRLAASKIRRFRIGTEFLFEPNCRDWTFNVLNHTPLTELDLSATNFTSDVWHDVFPNINTPRLEIFAFAGEKVDVADLTLFLEHHASTLKKIRLDIPVPQSAQPYILGDHMLEDQAVVYIPTMSESRTSLVVPLDPMIEFYFPKLTQVELTPLFFPWFVNANIRASQKRDGPPCLPKLSRFQILTPVSSVSLRHYQDVDSALAALTRLIAFVSATRDITESAKRSSGHWFSELCINCCSIDEVLTVAWIQTHISDPNSAFLSMKYLETLELSAIRDSKFESDIFQVLPGFLNFFPGLKRLRMNGVVLEDCRACGGEYWQVIRTSCAMLEKVRFNWDVSLTINDLIEERWFEDAGTML